MNGQGDNASRSASTDTSSARSGARSTVIQPGFLNRAARRGPQAARQPAAASLQTPRGAAGQPVVRGNSLSSSVSPSQSTSAASARPRWPSQEFSWHDLAMGTPDESSLAVMLPEEGFTRLHVAPEAGRSDDDFKAACYALPFPASDGRAALACMSFEGVPFASREIYEKACRYYQRAGIQAPPFTMADGNPYVPIAPLYMATDEGEPPLLFDYTSMILWPLIDVKRVRPRSGPSAIPCYEGRQIHFLVGPPVNDAPPLGNAEGEDVNSALSNLFEIRQQMQQLLGDVAISETPHYPSRPGPASPSTTAAVPTATTSTLPSQPGAAPQARVSREEHTAQASLMPADGNFYFDMYSGRRPAAHYQLPFLAADGRQTIVLMPSAMFPEYRAGTTQGLLEVFDAWRVAPPDTDVPNHPPIPYTPIRPTFVPANPSNNLRPAMLVDQSSGYIWPLITTSTLADEDVPGGNPHKAHYAAGAPMWGPPFDPLEIDNGAFPEIRPEDSPYHGPRPELPGFPTGASQTCNVM